ncbi:hypothetical protein B0H14DRAFT_2630471 [Mycena olivaceomarginata]|nr:hypothetical protein B0H14DRAFT_2630471 [Mycena olivaceomarginata]
MVAIPPRRLAQLRPGADVGMISASARRPALLCLKHGVRTFLPVRNFEAQATPRLPRICHATPATRHRLRHHVRAGAAGAQTLLFRRSRYEEKLLAGMGSEIVGNWAREMRNGAGAAGVSSELHSQEVWTHTLVPVEGARCTAALGKEEEKVFGGGGGARWMVGEGKRRDKYVAVWQYLLPRSMIAERILDTPPTVGKCRNFPALHRLALAICRRPRAATDSRLRRLALTPTLSACSLRSMPAHLSLLPSLPVPLFSLTLGSVLSMDPSHLPRSSPPPPTALFCSSYSSSLGSSLLPLNARPCRLSSRAARADSGGLVQQTRWVMIALGKVLRTAQARRLGSQCTRRAGLYF